MSTRKSYLSLALILGLLGVMGMLALLDAQKGHPTAVRAQGTTRYVASGGNDAGDCSDSANPCRTVQYAVDQATSGDEIRIAAGTYGDINTYGGLAQVVYISKTVALRGGYTTANWITPDPDTNLTTLDADGQGRVVYITGEITPTIENLRITGGNAGGLGGDYFGDAGGGVYVITATAIISNNLIYDNLAPGGFFDDGIGGGIYATASAPFLYGNSILNNEAGGGSFGGGMGGGLYFDSSQPTLEANHIWENLAGGDFSVGGGIALGACQGFTLTNNIIADNDASYRGTEIYLQHISGVPSQGRFIHNTIARNQSMADMAGIGVTGSGTVVTFTNTIIAGHDTGINVSFSTTATLHATLWDNATNWGDVGAIFTGTVNLFGDPNFLNPGGGDYHIAASSPAYNQGVDAGVVTDIDSEPRDAYPDLGADEAGAQSLQAIKLASDATLYPGDSLTYTLEVRSASTLSVTNVVLTDTFPSLQHPLGASTDRGSCNIVDSGYGGLVTCAFGDLETGQSAHITLTAQVTTTLPPNSPHNMRNNALVTGDQSQTSAYADTVLEETPNCLARVNGSLPDYLTVQEAVDAASAGDEVWIAGTCRGVSERLGLNQQAYVSKTLTMRGGYSSDFSVWDPGLYPTTLDAEQLGRVVYATGEIIVALEHLYLTGGSATGLGGIPDGFGNAGGGLYALYATLYLSNCQITNNVASLTAFENGFGGGMTIFTGTLKAVDSAFTSNSATTGNWGLGHGGGLYAEGSTIHLEGSKFERNHAAASVVGFGGGTYVYESDLEADSTLWLSNTVSTASDWGQGGGLFLMGTRPFTLTNCVLAGNRAYDGSGESGGGLWVEDAPGVLLHPTIARNGWDEGLHVDISTTLAITNGIISSHTVGILAKEGSTVTVNGVLWHDNVTNTVAVTAAIQVSNAHTGDPAFSVDGYHLTETSDAIDSGVNVGVATDIDAQSRPNDSGYDLGADEFFVEYQVYLPLVQRDGEP